MPAPTKHDDMKTIYTLLLVLSLFSTLSQGAELTGLWTEYDEDTKNPEALIRIEKLPDNSYAGTIEKILVPTGSDAPTCKNCPGELKDKPLIGLRILSGLKQTGKLKYEHGEITDPDEARTYHCIINMKEDGASIVVTGYLGFNWIGHSEVWRKSAASATQQ